MEGKLVLLADVRACHDRELVLNLGNVQPIGMITLHCNDESLVRDLYCKQVRITIEEEPNANAYEEYLKSKGFPRSGS